MNLKISVLMGIYNCASTLEEAVESIQNQTYENWELILCDDGSRDGTLELAEQLQKRDPRIILLRNEKNMGLNVTLNKCLQAASGEYIARMDGDDISLPDRFERQMHILQTMPQFDITSTPMILFDENGEWGQTYIPEYPSVADVIGKRPICHAPVMLRKASLDAVGGYAEGKWTQRVEDTDLWIRLYENGSRCYNLQEPLYKMRNDQNASNRRKYKYRINESVIRLKGCRRFHMPFKCYVQALAPMIYGMIPGRLRLWLRRKIGYR